MNRTRSKLGTLLLGALQSTTASTSSSGGAIRGIQSMPSAPRPSLLLGLALRSRRFASSAPRDPRQQADWLRSLNNRGQHEEVVRAYEAAEVTSTEGTLGEYLKALVKLDRMDTAAMLRTLQRGQEAAHAAPRPAPSTGPQRLGSIFDASGFSPAFMQSAAGAGGMGVAGGASLPPPSPYPAPAPTPAMQPFGAATGYGYGALGSNDNPLYMRFKEPSMSDQLWKTLRTILGYVLLLSFIGTMLGDKGGGGIGAQLGLKAPDLKPQKETSTKFGDVKGVDEAKSELEEIVDYLKDPTKFTRLGGKLPKGLLLVGPPGTGKTMLARAIAGEAGVPFFYASGSEFEEMFVGVGARRVRDLFSAARKHSPCLVFIDEIDAVGGKRSAKEDKHSKMTLNQLLVEMDGFKASEGIIVIAATNFPESLDKALIRPGRFDRQVTVPLPDVEGRYQILEVHSRSIRRAPDIDMRVIARGTPGFSGAELANLINIGALRAAREGRDGVMMADLEFAKDRILMGAERKLVMSEKARKLTAYHEGGHALMAVFTRGSSPIHKATIVPRGQALGLVQRLPEDDEYSKTLEQLIADLDVAMGGRAAEELIFGASEVTTGAASDLETATRIARMMVTRWGFSDKLGPLVVKYGEEGSGPYGGDRVSGETRHLIEVEVKRIVTEAYDRAKKTLKKHEYELHALAKALLEKETLTGSQIKAVLQAGGKLRDQGLPIGEVSTATMQLDKVLAAVSGAGLPTAA